jgi:hypothetical protein
MTSTNIYYVYAYLRVNGSPYYIGKGSNRRAIDKHISGAMNITPKDKSRIIVLESNLTELGALAIERRMIRWYGRKDLGTGVLRNMTDGGDGVSGAKLPKSDETRKKMGDWQRGKPKSTEHRVSMSKAQLGTKKGEATEERKKKISESKLGKKRKPFSDEWKRKIGESLKRRHELKINQENRI